MTAVKNATAESGGSFLIEDPRPEDVFTPEDFSDGAEADRRDDGEFCGGKDSSAGGARLRRRILRRRVKLLREAGDLGLMASTFRRSMAGWRWTRSRLR